MKAIHNQSGIKFTGMPAERNTFQNAFSKGLQKDLAYGSFSCIVQLQDNYLSLRAGDHVSHIGSVLRRRGNT